MYEGQGIHCLTKAFFCAYLQNNLHKWTQIFATLPPKNRDVHSIAKSRTGATLFLPSGPNNNGTLLQQWKSRRCAFMAFASLCGFAANYFHLSNISVVSFNCLHLSNISFSLFRFLSQMKIYTFQLERKKKSLGLKLKTSYSESIFLLFQKYLLC